MHGCYAGRVYDMAVVVPGLPEGPGYARDAALAALVRLLPSLSTDAVEDGRMFTGSLRCECAQQHGCQRHALCASPTPRQ